MGEVTQADHDLARKLADDFGYNTDESGWLAPLLAAHRLSGYQQGVADERKRASDVAKTLGDMWHREWRADHKTSSHLEGKSDGADEIHLAIRKGDAA